MMLIQNSYFIRRSKKIHYFNRYDQDNKIINQYLSFESLNQKIIKVR